MERTRSVVVINPAPDLFGWWAAAVMRLRAYLELTKPRITLLLLLVAVAAFWVAADGAPDLRRLTALAAGVSVLAGGMFALNQYMERDIDALMPRTEDRPLPSGRLQPVEALWLGFVLSVAALGELALTVNVLTAALGAATLASYLLVYTPLKRVTPHCTLLGAFPGAAPPLLGWAAARGELNAGAWALFAILLLWQFPHFHAIAALYKDEYARAGVRLWAVVEGSGRTTAWQILAAAVLLIPASAAPSALGISGPVYLCGAVAAGCGFLCLGMRWARLKSRERAQQLLLASVAYLPGLLALMVLDLGGSW